MKRNWNKDLQSFELNRMARFAHALGRCHIFAPEVDYTVKGFDYTEITQQRCLLLGGFCEEAEES